MRPQLAFNWLIKDGEDEFSGTVDKGFVSDVDALLTKT
jgi:hypothetical protein